MEEVLNLKLKQENAFIFVCRCILSSMTELCMCVCKVILVALHFLGSPSAGLFKLNIILPPSTGFVSSPQECHG